RPSEAEKGPTLGRGAPRLLREAEGGAVQPQRVVAVGGQVPHSDEDPGVKLRVALRFGHRENLAVGLERPARKAEGRVDPADVLQRRALTPAVARRAQRLASLKERDERFLEEPEVALRDPDVLQRRRLAAPM